MIRLTLALLVLLVATPAVAADCAQWTRWTISMDNIPANAGPPWDAHVGEQLIEADCPGDGTVDLTIGNDLDYSTFINETAHYWDGSAWQSFTLSGTPGPSGWIAGTATATLTGSELPDLSETNYVIAFICMWPGQYKFNDSGYMCGWRDTLAKTQHWSMQAIRLDAGGAPPRLLPARVDNTHNCADIYSGPTVTFGSTLNVGANDGSIGSCMRPGGSGVCHDGTNNFDSGISDETVIDLRNTVVQLGREWRVYQGRSADTAADSAAIVGGVIDDAGDSRSLSWSEAHQNGTVVRGSAPDMCIDGLRATNIRQDFYQSRMGDNDNNEKSDNVVIKDNWIDWNRDDVFENDKHSNGNKHVFMTIEDNLVDGAYMGISHQNEGGDTGTIDDNTTTRMWHTLLKMENMPEPFGSDGDPEGWGKDVCKQCEYQNDPRVELAGNVFYIEENVNDGLENFRAREIICKTTLDRDGNERTNVLLWQGSGTWPEPEWEDLANDGCFEEIMRADTDGASAIDVRWDEIVQNWIDCHPEVGRISDLNDPASTPANCDPTDFGGLGM